MVHGIPMVRTNRLKKKATWHNNRQMIASSTSPLVFLLCSKYIICTFLDVNSNPHFNTWIKHWINCVSWQNQFPSLYAKQCQKWVSSCLSKTGALITYWYILKHLVIPKDDLTTSQNLLLPSFQNNTTNLITTGKIRLKTKGTNKRHRRSTLGPDLDLHSRPSWDPPWLSHLFQWRHLKNRLGG